MRQQIVGATKGAGMGVRGVGRVMFAALLLLFAGMINIVYGIGALDDANVFVGDARLIFDDLNALGWMLIVVGVIQLIGGASLMGGGGFGRAIGVFAGSLGAIAALLSVGSSHPWWSLGVFFLCIYVVHGIIVYGEDERAAQV
jgi:hypothetical protein